MSGQLVLNPETAASSAGRQAGLAWGAVAREAVTAASAAAALAAVRVAGMGVGAEVAGATAEGVARAVEAKVAAGWVMGVGAEAMDCSTWE